MEKLLTEKQNIFILRLLKERESLEQIFLSQHGKLNEKINNAIEVILHEDGIEFVPNIEFQEGKLIIPDKEKIEMIDG